MQQVTEQEMQDCESRHHEVLPKELRKIVKAASGVFIYAASVDNYVKIEKKDFLNFILSKKNGRLDEEKMISYFTSKFDITEVNIG